MGQDMQVIQLRPGDKNRQFRDEAGPVSTGPDTSINSVSSYLPVPFINRLPDKGDF